MLFEAFLVTDQPTKVVERESSICYRRCKEEEDQIRDGVVLKLASRFGCELKKNNLYPIESCSFVSDKVEEFKCDRLYLIRDPTCSPKKPWEDREILIKAFKDVKGYFGSITKTEQVLGKVVLRSIEFESRIGQIVSMGFRDEETRREISVQVLNNMDKREVEVLVEKNNFDPIACADVMIRCSDPKQVTNLLKSFPETLKCGNEIFEEGCRRLSDQGRLEQQIADSSQVEKQALLRFMIENLKSLNQGLEKKTVSSMLANKKMMNEVFEEACSKLASDNCLESTISKIEKINETRLILELMDKIKNKNEQFEDCIDQVFKTVFWHLTKHIGQVNLSPEVQGCFTLISEFSQRQTPPPPPLVDFQSKSSVPLEFNVERSNLAKKSSYLRLLQKAQQNKISLTRTFSINDALEDLKKESDRVSKEMSKLEETNASLYEQLKETFAKKFGTPNS